MTRQESDAFVQKMPGSAPAVAGIFTIVAGIIGAFWYLAAWQGSTSQEDAIQEQHIEKLEKQVAEIEAHGSPQVAQLMRQLLEVNTRITADETAQSSNRLEGVQQAEQVRTLRRDVDDLRRLHEQMDKDNRGRDDKINRMESMLTFERGRMPP